MYTITLGDGTEFKEVTIDGMMCYVAGNFTHSDFDGKLNHVTIAKTGEDPEDIEPGILPGMYHNMKIAELCPCRFKPGYTMFRFEFMSAQEMHDMKVDARLDYLEMMNDM